MLMRVEYDVISGERVEIDVIAYRNDAGDVLVLDAIDPTPEGYEAFDPGEVDDSDKLE